MQKGCCVMEFRITMKATTCGALIATMMLFAGCSAGSAASPPTSAPSMVHIGVATTVSEFRVELVGGEAVAFETVDLTGGSDPVLHLLDSSGREVAHDDNGGEGRGALLRYRARTDGGYWLVIRARSNTTAGSATILRNGGAWRSRVPFAGWDVTLNGLRAGEMVDTVELPNGAGPVDIVYLLGSDGISIERRVVGRSQLGVRYAATSNSESQQVVVAAPRSEDATSGRMIYRGTSGGIELLRNDAAIPGHDSDQDLLGNELEIQLQLCEVSFIDRLLDRCRYAIDPRDTDGDGIRDSWEVLGRADVSPAQPLPLWGASPRHKDLFVEVDFMRRTLAENQQKVDLRMPPPAARSFVAAWGDDLTTAGWLRSAHAKMIQNPDGKPGIAVHLDTGVAPQQPSDATIYGDWGGHSDVDAIQTNGTWAGLAANAAWQSNMLTARRGIFRYANGYGTGGGQNGSGFAADYNMTDMTLPAHETGHTMSLGHAALLGSPLDNINCKSNYPSLMNYGLDVTAGFADGGFVQPGQPAIDDFPPLNNVALVEQNAVSPQNTRYLDLLQKRYLYYIDRDTGSVDWNRDGMIAPAGKTVRAYANFAPRSSGGCEYTRMNDTTVTTTQSTQDTALARMGGRLYAFYADSSGAVHSAYSASSWSCQEVAQAGCIGSGWHQGPDIGLKEGMGSVATSQGPAPIGGVDAAHIRVHGEDRLLVVAIDSTGRVFERLLAPAWYLNGVSLSPVGQVGAGAVGSPTLATGGLFDAYLAYRDMAGHIRVNHFLPEYGWTGENVALDEAGNPLTGALSTSPGLLQTYMPSRPAEYALYAVAADSTGRLNTWRQDPGTGRWSLTPDLETHPASAGRPSLAWVPSSPAAVWPGRLYLLYRTPSDVVRWMMSYKAGPGASETIGLDSYYDNAWFKAFGLDTIYEPGVDRNLRVLYTNEVPKEHFKHVMFRPEADGIKDFLYRDTNDWKILRDHLCYGVQLSLPASDRLACPT